VHGEWWFNVFEDGVLCTRNIKPKGADAGIYQTEQVPPAKLDALARELDDIADEVDALEFRLRRSGHGDPS
jgi:hypothetical protein